ncbi:hypothetical protein MM236_06500 [Belliella sp. DSM 107340]|uniref:TolB-like 6-blade propeller-like n=1 Tax=Belliella calami TaxID=2923436 RepID=A0ABS9UN66_9BACT|nr:hypothetical protein [Belliella calami]MCH7397630.1 hypothetical protein [Belliella calami]
MKIKTSLFLFIIFKLISCQSSEERVFEIESGNLTILDSVQIDDSGFSFASVWNAKIYNDSILGFGDGSFSSINMFHSNTGDFLMTFESDSIESYIIPKRSYSNFAINGNNFFLLNHLLSKVYVFSLDKKYIKSIDLKFENELFKGQFDTFFENYNEQFFVSTEYSAGGLKETFKFSPLLTVIDKYGDYSYKIGSYPKPYLEGGLVLSANENKIIKDGKIYILNVAGVPILKEYLLNGDLNGVYKLESEHHDPEIGYYINDPFSAPLTDQFNGLASDQNSSKKVFYASYSSFDTRDREFGLGTYKWMLMKIDLENMTIKETEIGGAWHLNEVRNLIPQVKGDTVTILIREKDENLYLKRLIFD